MRILVIFIFLLPVWVVGQPFQNVLIDQGNANNGPEEPSIAMSFTNPNYQVAGVNIKVTYRSDDGGRTWKKQEMKSKYGVYGDPCILALGGKKFLYFHLSLPKGIPYVHESFLDRIVCQYSKNGGKRFSKGTHMGYNPPKDQDKEWAVYDVKRNRVYVSWTQFDTYGSKDPMDRAVILGAYSDNQGKTWSQPVVLSQVDGNCVDDDLTPEGAVPAVGNQGQMHVAWANNSFIYYTSYMPGDSIPRERAIATQVGGWTQEIEGLSRINGLPITVSDQSPAPTKGNVYVCWSDQRNGELNTDIFITRSTNEGESWSEPIQVNTDTTSTHQFLPWATVDQATGYLYIVYYDRSKYTDSQTDVVLAVSKDGGITFENVTISQSPFTPNEYVFFGDYINISAHNGIVRPIWTRYEAGKLMIYTAIIDNAF